jgi:endonuclease/exonuclease/phosphatase family metal-dependent hydrolase
MRAVQRAFEDGHPAHSALDHLMNFRVFTFALGSFISKGALALSLVTWNVAEFSDGNENRLHRLLTLIREKSPDVVLLQEVQSQTRLTVSKVGFRDYKILERRDSFGLPEGGLIALVKKQWSTENARYERFPSEMDRGELIFVLNNLCGMKQTITSVHLESPYLFFWRSRAYRIQQVEKLKAQSQQQSNWLVAGDMNLIHNPDADKHFPKEWVDTWTSLHPSDPGLTWDPDNNEMAYRSGGFILPGYRLDRVLFKSQQLIPMNVERLGVGVNPPLSDHYGLLVEFACRTKSSIKDEVTGDKE